MLYRVIVVDDEETVRKGIINKMDWAALGFQVAGEAANGLEALEVAEREAPDLVITDIKMPYMDGLEMLEQLAHILPGAKMLVISGFDDFEYAQTAIRLGVTEYLLKPISAEQMAETLARLKQNLDAEEAERTDMEALRKSYLESLPLLREQWLGALVKSQLTARQIEGGIRRYHMDLSGGAWFGAVLRQAGAIRGRQPVSADPELVSVMVRKLAEGVLDKGRLRFASLLLGDEVWILGCVDGDADWEKWQQAYKDVCALANKTLGLRVYVGVGAARDALDSVGASFREAQDALGFCGGDSQFVAITDVEPGAAQQLYLSEPDARALSDAVKLEDEAKVRQIMGRLFAQARAAGAPHSGFQLFALEVYTAVLRQLHIYGVPPEEVFGQENAPKYIYTTYDDAELAKWLTEAAVAANRRIRGVQQGAGKELVERAKAYIAGHYSDPELSLESLCRHLNVSSPYFSRVFKRMEGKTFVAYLTDLRLGKAVDLLNTTACKTYEVAEQVGYPEPNYFSYVFKKKFGVSPTKFRQEQGN